MSSITSPVLGRTIKFIILISTTAIFFTLLKISLTPNHAFVDLLRESLPGMDLHVMEVLRKHYLTPPSTLPYNFSTDPKYHKLSRDSSWLHIHEYIEEFFLGQRGGFFVEAGALDGEFLSNSLWLEQNLGWTGLLIEPDKDSYLQLLEKHRRAWSSNTCLSGTTYPKETVHVSVKISPKFSNVPFKWYMRGSSHEYGVTLNPVYEDFFLAAEESMYMVHCFPLASYLKVLNVTLIDLLSLDLQGSEEDVLKTIPWDEIYIKFIAVEITDINLAIPEYLKARGFTWVNHKEKYWSQDNIFIREELLVERRRNRLPDMHSDQ